ncbi:hypothetical protein BASA81_008856 [Batrachochytrium salamandrivorans]|nr:hypothetical protein BASA81_008856 [Batrachochytrium salamandrivorans]
MLQDLKLLKGARAVSPAKPASPPFGTMSDSLPVSPPREEYVSLPHFRKLQEFSGTQAASLLRFPRSSSAPLVSPMRRGGGGGGVGALESFPDQIRNRQEILALQRKRELELELEAVRLQTEAFRSSMQQEDLLLRERQREAAKFLLESRQDQARKREELLLSRQPLYDQQQRILSLCQTASPLHEAMRRLIDSHLYELDLIAPILHELLREPEFAAFG